MECKIYFIDCLKTYKNRIMIGYMYVLECAVGFYYDGSTIHIEVRIKENLNGETANLTKKNCQ